MQYPRDATDRNARDATSPLLNGKSVTAGRLDLHHLDISTYNRRNCHGREFGAYKSYMSGKVVKNDIDYLFTFIRGPHFAGPNLLHVFNKFLSSDPRRIV